MVGLNSSVNYAVLLAILLGLLLLDKLKVLLFNNAANKGFSVGKSVSLKKECSKLTGDLKVLSLFLNFFAKNQGFCSDKIVFMKKSVLSFCIR